MKFTVAGALPPVTWLPFSARITYVALTAPAGMVVSRYSFSPTLATGVSGVAGSLAPGLIDRHTVNMVPLLLTPFQRTSRAPLVSRVKLRSLGFTGAIGSGVLGAGMPASAYTPGSSV